MGKPNALFGVLLKSIVRILSKNRINNSYLPQKILKQIGLNLEEILSDPLFLQNAHLAIFAYTQECRGLRSGFRNIAQIDKEKGRIGMFGARILLVEDDKLLRDLVCRNLQARHHEVHLAADAYNALSSLRAMSFDLILLDINLPDQTGWEILRTAQREECLHAQRIDDDHCKLPVVVLSAVRVSPQRLAEFHPLAYLPKPFPMEALLRLAAEAAQRSKMNA